MAELKPRLMLATPGRKRRGFGSFFFILLIFAIGFYAGSKYGNSIFGDSETDTITAKNIENNSDLDGELSVTEQGTVNENIDLYNQGSKENSDQTTKTKVKTQDGLNKSSGLVTSMNTDNMGTHLSATDKASKDVDESLINNNSDNDTDESFSNKEYLDNKTGNYTIQVGAFATPEEAKGVADGYKSKGYDAYIVPIVNSRGEKWNLIKIGRFNNIDEAWDHSAYLKSYEGVEGYVELVEKETVANEVRDQAQPTPGPVPLNNVQ